MASSDLRPPNHKTIRKKKTRELPNLTDCHACKRRTNTTNPSDRIRILNSHWRIVLLCKSCHNLVESSKLCSYCLAEFPSCEDSGESVHQCQKCLRQVHRDCISSYSRFAPFSFSRSDCGSGKAEFSVCIDCWLPRLLDSKLRGAGSKGMNNPVSDSCSPGISRVSDCHERPRSAEEVGNDANCVARKKSPIAGATMEKAMVEGGVEREALELANGVLDMAVVDREGGQDEKSSDDCDLVDDCDEKLALRLHRAMNSSPRIIRGLHLTSKSCAKSSVVLEIDDDSSSGKMSGLDHNLDKSESQEPMETNSMNAGSEGNSVSVESQSCEKECVVVCGLEGRNGRPRLECDRFLLKYRRRESSKSFQCKTVNID